MLILASTSPRRREMFDILPVPYIAVASAADETPPIGVLPTECAEIIALRKARAVAAAHPNDIIVGADTIVAVDNEIFGKPRGRADELRMLRAYSGRTHEVVTGVAILAPDGREEIFSERTSVTFRSMSEEELYRYADTDEPYDKAGGYAVQGAASLFIERIEGDYNNVVGLPLCKLWTKLALLFPR